MQGQLLVGAMAWSRKADDLPRDPWYVLHSAVTGPDNGEGEFKLNGSVSATPPSVGEPVPTHMWWHADHAVLKVCRM